MEANIILGTVAGFLVHWLIQGFRAFGLTYAYLQRRYPDDSTGDLWRDFLVCLRAIPAGWMAYENTVHYLTRKDAWVEHKSPRWTKGHSIYGYKFLPRHEYRRQTPNVR